MESISQAMELKELYEKCLSKGEYELLLEIVNLGIIFHRTAVKAPEKDYDAVTTWVIALGIEKEIINKKYIQIKDNALMFTPDLQKRLGEILKLLWKNAPEEVEGMDGRET